MRLLLIGALAVCCVASAAKKKTEAPASPLDRYVAEAAARTAAAPAPSPGAIWSPGARLADAARDPRASQLDDTLTILVVENASAVASGTTQTERASSTANTISAAGGLTRALGPWANLAGTSGDTKLAGTGTTSRDIVISTTLTARVAGVMPNGALVVEASKDIEVNSERQTITVRGVARPADIGSDNSVRSDRLAQLELRVNGKGVVGDAIRRPFILYRLLLGLLPF
ncbi:MAG: flagellar basal body L-ring protein FlgH [Bryobacteraceae bacterium]|jgi:flagellar L-ring protein precursor FlgH